MSPIQIVLLAFAAFTILGVLVACVEICLAKRTRLVTSFSYGPIPDLSVVLFVIIVVCLLFAWARTASTTKTGDVHVSATLSEETILACPMMHKAQVAYLAWKEASESGTTVTRDKRYEIEQRIVRCLKPKQKIEFLGVPPSELGFYAQLEDGSRGVIVGDFNLTSEQIDSIYAEKLTGDGGKLISSERFFEMVQNKTLDEIDPDSIYRLEVTRYGGEIFAVLAFKVFLEGTGEFCRPMLVFDSNGVFKDCWYIDMNTHWNAWLLCRLPFVSCIYNQPWLTWIIDRYPYEQYAIDDIVEVDGILSFVLRMLVFAIYYVIVGLWMVFFISLPVLVLCGLLRFRYLFPYSNKVCAWVFSIIGVVHAYVFFVLVLADCTWLLVVPIILSGLVIGAVVLYIFLRERCTNCHLMFTKRNIGEYLVEEYDETRVRTREDYVGSTTEDWVKTTKKTTIEINEYGNVREHVSYEETPYERVFHKYMRRVFEDDYHVQVFRQRWKCVHCQHISHTRENHDTFLESREVKRSMYREEG